MSDERTPKQKYDAVFSSKAEKALEFALDVRKFEIDLYWKRAAYFWAFTGAALAGHLTVMTGKNMPNQVEALLITSSLGLIFSVAWYFVNRASKFWQANWEAHVDVLEDEVMGPIYKTLLQDRTSFWKFWSSYPFSVSRINQLLSLIVALVFAGLFFRALHAHYVITTAWEVFPTACVIFTFGALALLFLFGRTDPRWQGDLDRTVELYRRSTTITKYHGKDG